MRALAFSFATWLAVGSCHADDEQVAHPPDLARAVLIEQHRMHARFDAATRIEHAIAFGDLERVHVEAHALANVDISAIAPGWRPYFESLRDSATQLEASRGLTEAAWLTVTLAQRCASCHVAMVARVELPAQAPPPGGAKLAVEMQSHQWAATQMWWGLLAPSSEHWFAGARTLASAHLNIVAQSATPDSELEIDDVARVRLYANRALAMTDPDARASVFGAMLTTCAHCHAVLRDR